MPSNRKWKIIENARLIHRKRMFKAYMLALQAVLVKFGKDKIPSEKQIKNIMTQKASRLTVQTYKSAMVDSLNIIEDSYGAPLPVLRKVEKSVNMADLDAFELLSDVELAETIGMVKVKTVSKNYHNLLRKVHAKAIEEGLSTGKMAEAFRTASSQLAKRSMSDARRIAQTETTRIYSAGSLDAYGKSQVTEKKEWVSNLMGNPRHPPESNFDHLGANGEQVAVDKPFMRTGEALMHPGDPSGSAGNVIRCHCGLMPVIGKIIEQITLDEQKLNNYYHSGKFEFNPLIPNDLQEEIRGWKYISKSPYSDSFYNMPGKTWSDTPNGIIRISDHWNFKSEGLVHCRTDKPFVNGSGWLVARYDAKSKTYKTLKVIDNDVVEVKRIAERSAKLAEAHEALLEEIRLKAKADILKAEVERNKLLAMNRDKIRFFDDKKNDLIRNGFKRTKIRDLQRGTGISAGDMLEIKNNEFYSSFHEVIEVVRKSRSGNLILKTRDLDTNKILNEVPDFTFKARWKIKASKNIGG